MKVIKHGKLYDYLRPQKKWYALCPDCGRRVHTLTQSSQVLMCRCECEFECDKKDLTEDNDRRWFPTEEKLPKASYQSFNSHDCETFYKCPLCNRTFGSWSYGEQKKECPWCNGKIRLK